MADKLEEIKAREAKATKGPWIDDNGYRVYVERDGEKLMLCELKHNDVGNGHDNMFIAHAREDLPYLLNRLEAAERYIESDIAYRAAVAHAEYLDAAAARDAREKALDRWVAAKGEM